MKRGTVLSVPLTAKCDGPDARSISPVGQPFSVRIGIGEALRPTSNLASTRRGI